jgi:hypothetical protein
LRAQATLPDAHILTLVEEYVVESNPQHAEREKGRAEVYDHEEPIEEHGRVGKAESRLDEQCHAQSKER